VASYLRLEVDHLVAQDGPGGLCVGQVKVRTDVLDLQNAPLLLQACHLSLEVFNRGEGFCQARVLQGVKKTGKIGFLAKQRSSNLVFSGFSSPKNSLRKG
jgi:hypothetical protein